MSKYRLIDGAVQLAASSDTHTSTAARDLRVAVVAARFNDFIVDQMVDGAMAAWTRHGGDPGSLTLVRVPGAFELPLAARALAQTGRYDGVVALGCVIRGDTAHFDFVAGEAARGIAQAAYDSGVPVAFGVLTTETVEQAQERAATDRMNKGAEALETTLEMALLLREVGAP